VRLEITHEVFPERVKRFYPVAENGLPGIEEMLELKAQAHVPVMYQRTEE